MRGPAIVGIGVIAMMPRCSHAASQRDASPVLPFERQSVAAIAAMRRRRVKAVRAWRLIGLYSALIRGLEVKMTRDAASECRAG